MTDRQLARYAASEAVAIRSLIDRVASKIDKAIIKINENSEYITVLRDAGFDPDDLLEQIRSMKSLKSLGSVRDYANQLNSNTTTGILDMIIQGKELLQLAEPLGLRPISLVTSGVVRISNAVTPYGLTNYTRRSATFEISVVNDDTNSIIKLTVSMLNSEEKLIIEIPYHSVLDVNSQSVIPSTLFLSYKLDVSTGLVMITGYCVDIDIQNNSVMVSEGVFELMRLGFVSRFLTDLPYGVLICSSFIPNFYPEPDVQHSILFRSYGTDELFHIFREYTQSTLDGIAKDTLASSYGQAAIAAMATANNVLASTITRNEASYEYTKNSGSAVMQLSQNGYVYEVTEATLDGNYEESDLLRWPNVEYADGYDKKKIHFLRLDINVGYEIKDFSYSEGTSKFIQCNNLSPGNTEGKIILDRLSTNGTSQVECEFAIMPDVNYILSDAQTPRGVIQSGYLRLDGTFTPTTFDYNFRPRLTWKYAEYPNFDEGRGQIHFDNCYLPSPSSEDDYFYIGKKWQRDHRVYLRVRIDASRLLEAGSSTTIEMQIEFTYDGEDYDQNVTLTRRYVNTSNEEQRLVYEGKILIPNIRTYVINGFVTKLNLKPTPKKTLIWSTSNLNTESSSYVQGQYNILTGSEGLRSYLKYDDTYYVTLESNTSIKNGGTDHNRCRVPQIHYDGNLGDDAYTDMVSKNQIPVTSPYNYPTRSREMIIIGKRNSTHKVEGVYPDVYIQLPDPISVYVNGRYPFGTFTFQNFGTGPNADQPLFLDFYSSLQTADRPLRAKVVANNNMQTMTCISKSKSLDVKSIRTSSVIELSLPDGVFSNQTLTEDTINIWSVIELLLKYSTNLNEMIENHEARLSMVETTLNEVIDAVNNLSDTLRELISEKEQKPNVFGIIGQVLSFATIAIGMFFPIIGTSIGVLSQIVQGVSSIVDGDVANGALELTLGGAGAALGLYKFGKRLRNKYQMIDQPKVPFNLRDQKVKIGTYSKSQSMLPNKKYNDSPPPYSSIYPDNTSRYDTKTSMIKTSSVSTSIDDLNRKVVDNNSTVLNTYQGCNFSEFDWISILLSSERDNYPPTNIVLETTRDRRFLGEKPYSLLKDETSMFINCIKNNRGVRVQVSDEDMKTNFPSWPNDGLRNFVLLRDSYSSIGQPNNSLPIDRDILLPMLMAAGGTDSRNNAMSKLKTFRMNRSQDEKNWSIGIKGISRDVNVLDTVLEFPTNLQTVYSLIGSTNKDSPGGRDVIDRTIDFWQNNRLVGVLTDSTA